MKKKTPPKYVSGRETRVPRSTVTVESINTENAAFWEMTALRERVTANPHYTDAERAALLQNGEKAIREKLAAPKRAIRAIEDARRAKGTARSASARRSVTAERDRRIHDARANGKTPQMIFDSAKIRGKKKLSMSQIYRILQAPRP